MNTKKIAITGAAGNISYSLIFQLLTNSLFSQNDKIQLNLLDVKEAMPILQGVKYEIEDCIFESLDSVMITDNAEEAFADTDYILLIGAKPRSKGMQRSDLLLENANIFKQHAEAINLCGKKSTKIIVVGNPANTNALIVQAHTPNIAERNISSLMKLDQNRAKNILANKVEKKVSSVSKLVVWGNHSTTQYPNIFDAKIDNELAIDYKKINEAWVTENFIPRIQNRGAEIIEHRGKSSAASAASAIYDHLNFIINGSDDWESLGILSTGEYNITPDIFFSFPIEFKNGNINVVKGLNIKELSNNYIKKSEKELISERDIIKNILPKS
ncbi:MAG: malate dehydrogenase [Pseudomonadota bacterium]|nr:malate dehydrogenase [Pseudomonadota bacterium]